MNIRISRAHFPVTVLGPGRRIGLWVQGCSIGCKDCVSRDTWDADSGRLMPVSQLLQWCQGVATEGLDGVTISGGEPFEQPKALAALLEGLVRWRSTAALDFDILCYSGMPLRRLRERHARLLAQLDALIPEPFVASQPQVHRWRGSANQPLVCLSERGRLRYAAQTEAPADPPERRLQTMVDGDRVWVVGIPARGDMQALEQAVQARGLSLAQCSWRP